VAVSVETVAEVVGFDVEVEDVLESVLLEELLLQFAAAKVKRIAIILVITYRLRIKIGVFFIISSIDIAYLLCDEEEEHSASITGHIFSEKLGKSAYMLHKDYSESSL
jgi:hypothetical protein